jgi:UDP-GlcNAc:undecaprenyl-phosphate GlcNAc-1-phosphate transferase
MAKRFGFMDLPGTHAKRIHAQPIPRLGGVTLFIAFVAAVAASFILPLERKDPQEITRIVGVLLGGTLVFALGIYDDRRELSPVPQFVGQMAAAAIAIGFDIRIDALPNPFGADMLLLPPIAAIAFTLFWMVGMMNTVNWLDGLDGLSAGVTVIAAIILFVHTFRLEQYSVALLPLALAGCALGFLPYNFHPARLFLGSSGTYFLGFLLATISIIGGAKVATALLVLGMPILDVAWQIVRRISLRRAPWLGDRGHLHHRLFDLGFSQRQVVLAYYVLCGVFGLLALVLPSRLYKLYALIGLGLVVLIVIALVVRRSTLNVRR